MSRYCPAIIEVLPRQNNRATAIRIFPSKAAYMVSTGGELAPWQAELLNDLATFNNCPGQVIGRVPGGPQDGASSASHF